MHMLHVTCTRQRLCMTADMRSIDTCWLWAYYGTGVPGRGRCCSCLVHSPPSLWYALLACQSGRVHVSDNQYCIIQSYMMYDVVLTRPAHLLHVAYAGTRFTARQTSPSRPAVMPPLPAKAGLQLPQASWKVPGCLESRRSSILHGCFAATVTVGLTPREFDFVLPSLGVSLVSARGFFSDVQ